MAKQLDGYIAFFRGKQKEIYASTLLEAKEKASVEFKCKGKQYYEVHVHLCELAGEQVVHVADF